MKGMGHLGCQGFDPRVVIKGVGIQKAHTEFAPLWGQKGGPKPDEHLRKEGQRPGSRPRD
jgi:hypothetical protein